MEWAKTHTCKNCRWSLETTDRIVADDDPTKVLWSNTKRYCIYREESIKYRLDNCICKDWCEDEVVLSESERLDRMADLYEGGFSLNKVANISRVDWGVMCEELQKRGYTFV